MKHKNLTLTLTAAVPTLVTAAAYGQNNPLIATIPFGFRAVKSNLPAGRYMVARASGSLLNSGIMQLRNIKTGESVFLPSGAPRTESEDKHPRLVFRCGGESGCALATLWSGEGTGMEFATPALPAAEKERSEVAYLYGSKGK
jgi:hypothetical protein